MAVTIAFLVGAIVGWFLCHKRMAIKLERLHGALNWFLEASLKGKTNGHFLKRVSERLTGSKSAEAKKKILNTDWLPLLSFIRAAVDLLPSTNWGLRVDKLDGLVRGKVTWALVALAVIVSSLFSPTPAFAETVPDCTELENLPQLELQAGESLVGDFLEGCRLSNGTATFLVFVMPGVVGHEEDGRAIWEEPYYAAVTTPAYVPAYVAGVVYCPSAPNSKYYIKSELPFSLFDLSEIAAFGEYSISDENLPEFRLFGPNGSFRWGTCKQ